MNGQHITPLKTAGYRYSINNTNSKEKISLSLQDKEASKYLYTNGVKTCQFREKESQIQSSCFCAGNISKDFAVNNIKIAKLNGKGLRACC